MTVGVDGERGQVYTIYSTDLRPDGTILLYGGDSNPNGVRGFKSVMPEKVAPLMKGRRSAKS